MKHLVLALCASLLLHLHAQAAPLAPAASAGEEANILELEKQWYAMRMARDVSAIDRLLADDFIMTNSYGRVFTKSQVLQRYRAPEQFFKWKSFQTNDVKVKVYGDAAVVTGYASVDGEASDGRVVTSVRFTRVYVRSDGRWRLLAHQVTRIIR